MQSVVIHAEGTVRVEERPIPTLQTENDVLVKVVSSGLCGSDIPRIFAKGAHYYPITLGHEFSGYVESYGSAVTDLQPGDAVACVPLLPCFNCPQCQREYFSLCKQYQFVGSLAELQDPQTAADAVKDLINIVRGYESDEETNVCGW